MNGNVGEGKTYSLEEMKQIFSRLLADIFRVKLGTRSHVGGGSSRRSMFPKLRWVLFELSGQQRKAEMNCGD
jgi:hypothetical protein